MFPRILSLILLVACGGAEPGPGKAVGTEGLATELATCEGERDSAQAELGTCQGDLGTCASDLAEASVALQASIAAEAQTEALRAACELDLAAAAQDRDTCVGDLATCSQDLATAEQDLSSCEADVYAAAQDLATCEADVYTAEQDLATCEAERDQLQAELDAVALTDQDLIDFLGSEPGRAWVGYSVEVGGENTSAYSMWFLPDGTVIWWSRYGPRTDFGPLQWAADTWSVTGSTVTVQTPYTSLNFTYAAGRLLGSGNLLLKRRTGTSLVIVEAAAAVPTGAWGPCTATESCDGNCLVDDGSGGLNPMSLTWTYTPSGPENTIPFVRRAWSPTGATNAMWQSSAGDVAVDHSAAGNRWVQMPVQGYALPASVSVDNAGANGEVFGDVVVFVKVDDFF